MCLNLGDGALLEPDRSSGAPLSQATLNAAAFQDGPQLCRGAGNVVHGESPGKGWVHVSPSGDKVSISPMGDKANISPAGVNGATSPVAHGASPGL